MNTKNHMDKHSFTSQYNVENLVYYEVCNDPVTAIAQEKQIKDWNRTRKEKLIDTKNPEWMDLYGSILN